MNRLPSLLRQHIAAFRMLLAFTVLCGIVYPVVMWGVAQAAFKNQADGSLVTYNGKVVGSSLLCQEFVDAKGNPLPRTSSPARRMRQQQREERLRLRPRVLGRGQPRA
jgi:K+-transporting ATPase c subunit